MLGVIAGCALIASGAGLFVLDRRLGTGTGEDPASWFAHTVGAYLIVVGVLFCLFGTLW